MTQPLLSLDAREHFLIRESAILEGQCCLHNRAKGAVVEFEFCKQATLRGWEVLHMGGSQPCYDAIVTKSQSRGLFVQVRAAKRYSGKWGAPVYKVTVNFKNKPYPPNAYDVLAVYLPADDRWLFYGRCEVANKTGISYVLPAQRRKKTQHGSLAVRDPDNWELLDEVAQSLLA